MKMPNANDVNEDSIWDVHDDKKREGSRSNYLVLMRH